MGRSLQREVVLGTRLKGRVPIRRPCRNKEEDGRPGWRRSKLLTKPDSTTQREVKPGSWEGGLGAPGVVQFK